MTLNSGSEQDSIKDEVEAHHQALNKVWCSLPLSSSRGYVQGYGC